MSRFSVEESKFYNFGITILHSFLQLFFNFSNHNTPLFFLRQIIWRILGIIIFFFFLI